MTWIELENAMLIRINQRNNKYNDLAIGENKERSKAKELEMFYFLKMDSRQN